MKPSPATVRTAEAYQASAGTSEKGRASSSTAAVKRSRSTLPEMPATAPASEYWNPAQSAHGPMAEGCSGPYSATQSG